MATYCCPYIYGLEAMITSKGSGKMINRYTALLCQPKNIGYTFSVNGIPGEITIPREMR